MSEPQSADFSAESNEATEPQQQTQAEQQAQAGETTAAPQQLGGPPESSSLSQPVAPPRSGGPISLDRIRQLRREQQASPQAKPKSPSQPIARKEGESPSSGDGSSMAGQSVAEETASQQPQSASQDTVSSHREKGQNRGKGKPEFVRIPTPPSVAPKVAVPSRRAPLSADLENELNAALSGDLDFDKVLVGDESLQVGHVLEDGQRLQATVMKIHAEFVFVSLGGPNEGVLSLLQFEQSPGEGDLLDVIVRGYLQDENLYELTVPGAAIDVADWSEIKEGETVEALVTGSNAGGLECKVGSIRGFIPASQVALYRIENFAEFVGQKILCVITEANERRGNLVLSHRAVLERDRIEQRAKRFDALEIGAAVTGTVRKITDFGAFVDIGGLDGLLHISQLSWERVKHPSEVLEEGQQIQVRVDKIDSQTGKIGLSYRSLQEHPWTNVQSRFPVGSVHQGVVTRIAEFGAFVKLATGVEGLVHLSELAHHRVAKVSSVVGEGQEVEVKVLSIDEEKQRIALSIKGAQAAPPAQEESAAQEAGEAEQETPTRTTVKNRGPLKGGIGRSSGGEQFGLKW